MSYRRGSETESQTDLETSEPQLKEKSQWLEQPNIVQHLKVGGVNYI